MKRALLMLSVPIVLLVLGHGCAHTQPPPAQPCHFVPVDGGVAIDCWKPAKP